MKGWYNYGQRCGHKRSYQSSYLGENILRQGVIIRLVFGLLLFMSSAVIVAQRSHAQDAQPADNREIARFILDVKVKTFDCPNEEYMPQLEAYLLNPSITEKQRFQLQLEKTHWQICTGSYAQAEVTVDSIIANPNAQQSEEYYALAVYQKGFLFDVKEDNRRCNFYQQSKELSLGKFDDISLSSELGLMTYCEPGIDEGTKLKRLFDILELYSLRGDTPTIAHIHNNIGLIYGRLGQHVLAAEQFQKTYELGLLHYQGANKYASIISVFTSLLASGQFEQAQLTINELDKARAELNIPLVHAWYFYAKGRYYLRLDRPQELQQTVIDWTPHLEGMENTIFAGMHRWFSFEVCINEQNTPCVAQFIEQEETKGPKALSFLGGNVDYLTLMAKAYSVIGDFQRSKDYWTKFAFDLRAQLANNQSSGKVLGVANLYNKIGELESTLAKEQLDRDRMTLGAIVIFMLAMAIVMFVWRKKQAQALAYDSVTRLLNSRAAINEIRKVPSPSQNKTNALALFDLANFKEVNRLLGSSNADDAIRQIASTFKNITRGSDIVGRFAPEQFILCLPDIEEESAKAFFDRVRFALENTNLGKHQELNINVTSSMSIYLANQALDDVDEVLDDMMLSISMKAP